PCFSDSTVLQQEKAVEYRILEHRNLYGGKESLEEVFSFLVVGLDDFQVAGLNYSLFSSSRLLQIPIPTCSTDAVSDNKCSSLIKFSHSPSTPCNTRNSFQQLAVSMERCLPVGDDHHGRDNIPSLQQSVPTSAEDYLMNVRHEANNCPDVVVAENFDSSRFNSRRTVNYTKSSSLLPTPPSEEIQDFLIHTFSENRQKFMQYKAKFMKSNSKIDINFPAMKDENGWLTFCLGSNKHRGNPPTLALLASMKYAVLIKAFENLTEGFNQKEFTDLFGQWLYALLVCVEKPLLPETTSMLRILARNCSERRETLATDDHLVSALNLIIVIVARYFSQTDLI
ncbi:Gem-associated protein 2, partial [Trichoplax sp. H2]